jgi:hypothetical protein
LLARPSHQKKGGSSSMHIYRFFQPHHNPRLLSTPLRQLELSELEQAASELRKAIERAQQRTTKRAVPPLMPEHFTDLLKAIRFVESSLQTLCDAHPGDQPHTMLEMIQERQELAGWETWTSLLEEQLVSSHESPLAELNRNEPSHRQLTKAK